MIKASRRHFDLAYLPKLAHTWTSNPTRHKATMTTGTASKDDTTLQPSKKLHGRAFYESIGSPKFVLAPMVDQSEFAWRLLTRSFLLPESSSPLLAYTPMFHSRLWIETPNMATDNFQAIKWTKEKGQKSQSQLWLDGNPAFDRPLIVQFCANDPDTLLKAAQTVVPYCDAVDLNLGCPQGIAKRGAYGAFLQEDQQLIYRLINKLHKELPIPVTAKMRVLETKEKTLEYAKLILSAGASIITVHGRQRHQKGHFTGIADWKIIRYLKDNLPPDSVIFANGNILQHSDIKRALKATGVDGIMSAEGNLHDPAIFATPPPPSSKSREYWRGRNGQGGWRVDAVVRRYLDIIHKYVMNQEPPTRKPLFIPSDPPGVGSDPLASIRNTTGKHPLDSTSRKRPAEDTGEEKEKEEEEEEGRGGELGENTDSYTMPPPAKKSRSQRRLEKAENRRSQKQGPLPGQRGPNFQPMRAHMFGIMRSLVGEHIRIRDALSACHGGDMDAFENVLAMLEKATREALLEYEREHEGDEQIVLGDEKEKEQQHRVGGNEEVHVDIVDDSEDSEPARARCKRPWWVCQPYIRPLPKEAIERGILKEKEKGKGNDKQNADLHDNRSEKDAGQVFKPQQEVNHMIESKIDSVLSG